MSRFGVWLICCTVVVLMLAAMGGGVNIRALLSIFAILGAPLLLHWGLSSNESTKDVKNA